MNKDQIDRFERQLSAMALDYGIHSLGVTFMFLDDAPARSLRFAALFIPNPRMNGSAAHLAHRALFEQSVASMKTFPGAYTVSEETTIITVVPGKPKGGTHDS